jgi:hypothetical protein
MDAITRSVLQLLGESPPLRGEKITRKLGAVPDDVARALSEALQSGWVENPAMVAAESGGLGPPEALWRITEAGMEELRAGS